jgi:hypothetical protein
VLVGLKKASASCEAIAMACDQAQSEQEHSLQPHRVASRAAPFIAVRLVNSVMHTRSPG